MTYNVFGGTLNLAQLQLEQMINENLIFFGKRHVHKQRVTSKCVIFALVLSQQIKEIIANRHELLNKFVLARTP